MDSGSTDPTLDVIAFLGANDRYADPWVIKDAMEGFRGRAA